VESETPGCKTKEGSCENIMESKEWCETIGAVEGDVTCIWLEGNDEMGYIGKCIDKVCIFLFYFILFYFVFLILILILI
jgi:hypothetical protein